MKENEQDTRFTPGPWRWYNGNSYWRLGQANDQRQHDAVLRPTVDSDGHPNLVVSGANKLLIASAPEMYATLTQIKALWDKHGFGDDDAESEPLFNQLCAVLAQAKGGK